MHDSLNRPIGWVNEDDPNGIGYQIMTHDRGLVTFDIEDHAEFIQLKADVQRYLEQLPKE